MTTVKRRMRPNRIRRLERRFCHKTLNILYRAPRGVVRPLLLPVQWGDGRQIIGLRPIIIRMSWYVVAIDSRMEIGRPTHGFEEDAAFRDLLDDDIYEEIEDYFGYVHSDEADEEGFDAFAAWPRLNHSGGHEWWQEHKYYR